MPSTTGPSQTTQDKGQTKIRKGVAPRIQRDNDRDNLNNAATHQESRDQYEREHFHAAGTTDIDRSQSSARAQKREAGQERERASTGGGDREYGHSDSSHYNDDNRNFQRFTSGGGNRSAHARYEKLGHGVNKRPDYSEEDYLMDEPGQNAETRAYRGNGREDKPWHGEVERQAQARQQQDRYDGHGSYDRRDYNDRQNGWQANGRADNRSDGRYNNNWQDRQWRETAKGGRPEWRPNEDSRNEQRNGSQPDRDRGSYGNSRFRDDDYGYQASRRDSREYGRQDERGGDREPNRYDARQPRGYEADSERDYNDRNPSRERDRNR